MSRIVGWQLGRIPTIALYALHASTNIVRKVGQEKGSKQSADTDLDLIRRASGNRAQLNS
jgi:hypothetical protein